MTASPNPSAPPSPIEQPIAFQQWYNENCWRILKTTVIDNPYIPKDINGHTFPTVIQADFLTLPQREALFEGGGGGGKTSTLLAAGLQYVDDPDYTAIIFRRTLTELKMAKGIIEVSHEWLGDTDAEWDGGELRWHFPSGASLSFGYMATAQDHTRYRGPPFMFVGFDELSLFPLEHQYQFLFSRQRRPAGCRVPLRMRATTNPGGVGAAWVYERFIRPGPTIDRCTVRSTLDDNPGLDKAAYEESLNQLDPVTREQVRHGNWKAVRQGRMFPRAKFKVVESVPPLLRTVRSWDLAATEENQGNDPDFLSGAKGGMGADGNFYIVHMIHQRSDPAEVDATISQTARADGRATGIRIEQEGGASGKMLIDLLGRTSLMGYDLQAMIPGKDKVTRAMPLSAAVDRGQVYLLAGRWNSDFLDEMCFVAGTRITTRRGDVPIEHVTADDLALTRAGWRRVQWHGLTRTKARVITMHVGGVSVQGTPEHPVWIAGHGFIPMAHVRVGDRVLCVNSEPVAGTRSFTAASNSTATRIRPTSPSAIIIPRGGGELRPISTVSSIARKSGRSPTDTMFITGTKTRPTTIRGITSCARPASTHGYTSDCGRSPVTSVKDVADRSSQMPCGSPCIVQRDAGTPRERVSGSSEPAFAKTANALSRRLSSTPAIARDRAQNRLIGPRTETPISRVLCVAAHSPAAAPAYVVREAVVTSLDTSGGQRAVYNLQVEDVPEYFANGILVHNCAFPSVGVKDDQVDATSNLFNDVAGNNPKINVAYGRPITSR